MFIAVDGTVTFVEYAVPVILRQFKQWHRTCIVLSAFTSPRNQHVRVIHCFDRLASKAECDFPTQTASFHHPCASRLKVSYVRVVRGMKSISDRMRISSVAGPDQHACIAPHVVQM